MTTTTDPDLLARVERLIIELERIVPATGDVAGPLAAVNPDGTPGHVAADELIESAWGNAVVDTLDRRPRGRLASAFSGTVQSGIQQTPVTLTGTTVSYTAVGGRTVIITAKVNYSKAGADSKGQCVAVLTHDGAQVDIASASTEAPGDESLFLIAEVAPAAGSHTVLLQGFTTAGFANAKERKILIEDAGKI
jgi:hypothetical protein